jgi:hypothetical protein
VTEKLHFFVKPKNYKTSFSYRDILEAGSVWKGKLKRIENDNAKFYLVLKRGILYKWGWVISER